MSLSRPRPSSKLSATATATRPKVGKAATTVPILDPPREEPPRVLAGSREKVVPLPGPHAPPGGLVQGARRFVHEKHLRLEGEGPGYGDALLLADGEGLGLPRRQSAVQADHV